MRNHLLFPRVPVARWFACWVGTLAATMLASGALGQAPGPGAFPYTLPPATGPAVPAVPAYPPLAVPQPYPAGAAVPPPPAGTPAGPAAGQATTPPPPASPTPPGTGKPAGGPPAPASKPETPPPPPSKPEPAWYSPAYWWHPVGWKNSFEVGIAGATGNAETFDLRVGTDWKRSWEQLKLAWSINYAKAHARSVETKHNALFHAETDWKLGNSRYAWLTTTDLEYDEFRAFDLRWVINSGLSYHWFQRKDLKLSTRFGGGTSREFGGPDDRWVPELLLGARYEHQWTKAHKFTLQADYFPDVGNFSEYRFVGKASWEWLLDEASNLSLKLSATDRYDSTPQGRKPNDVDYALLLLWKF